MNVLSPFPVTVRPLQVAPTAPWGATPPCAPVSSTPPDTLSLTMGTATAAPAPPTPELPLVRRLALLPLVAVSLASAFGMSAPSAAAATSFQTTSSSVALVQSPKLATQFQQTTSLVASPAASSQPTAWVSVDTRPLARGDAGDAVWQLQKGLNHYVATPETGVFDAQTEASVKTFQATRHLTVDGRVGARTTAALFNTLLWEKGVVLELNHEAIKQLPPHLRVEVDQQIQRANLVNIDDGEVLRSYPISSGTADHPTPRGQFRVGSVTEKPTWHPPNSSWVTDPTPMPPGPNNPLGPVFLRLGSSDVGLHGVPPGEFGSLGKQSASHGCIRMYPQDAWELHSIVHRGTPVVID